MTDIQSKEAKYSKLSIISFLFLLASPIGVYLSFSRMPFLMIYVYDFSEELFFFSPICAAAAFIFGLMALILSRNSHGVSGLWMAKVGLFGSMVFMVVFLLFMSGFAGL